MTSKHENMAKPKHLTDAPIESVVHAKRSAVDANHGPLHAERVFTVVPANRVINVTLPPDFPIGPVEVILISKARWRDSAP